PSRTVGRRQGAGAAPPRTGRDHREVRAVTPTLPRRPDPRRGLARAGTRVRRSLGRRDLHDHGLSLKRSAQRNAVYHGVVPSERPPVESVDRALALIQILSRSGSGLSLDALT